MRLCRFSLRLTLAVTAAAAFAAPARSQGYGPNDQILTIGATEFQPYGSDQAFALNAVDGYRSGPGLYAAPLRLPDGAEITQMCYYLWDTDSSVTDAFIIAMKLPAGGQGAGETILPGSDVEASFNIGYGAVCTDGLSFTVLSDADLDGMGSAHLSYRVVVENGPASRFGGIRITWHRQVSPAPATATFADVAVAAFGFQQIEALAASGITGGCGGGNYCPDQNVTRAQMAVFLAKALGLQWP